MSNPESRWFLAIVLLLTIFTIGVTIANIYYYNKIKNGSCNAVTNGEANTLMWVNIIVLVTAAIVMIWDIWRLFFTHKPIPNVNHYMLSQNGNDGTMVASPILPSSTKAPTIPTNSMTGMTAVSIPTTPTYIRPTSVATSMDSAAMIVAPEASMTITSQQQYL